MKNILISGGAGFIGSNLTKQLILKGHCVTILDNLSTQIHGKDPYNSFLFKSIKDKVKFIQGTVTSRQDWEKALHQQDIIVHLAAETGTGQSMYEIERYTSVNIGGTAILLDLLANTSHHIKKVIIASSRSIYGEGRYLTGENKYVYPKHRTAALMDAGDFEVTIDGGNEKLTLVSTDEDSKIHPSSVYGITKQNQEQMIMTVCPTIGVAPVAFRYQNVYGPGQSLTNPYTGILSIFSSLIKNHKPINIFEDGKESRDFVFIDDVVQATILGIEKDEANDQVFNVGTGVPIDVLTVANELIKNYGINVPLNISGNYRLGDIRHNFADLTKINHLLNFRPEISFSEGIKRFANWVNSQEIAETNYGASIEEMQKRGLLKAK